jgi:O-antigen chain-terminating methyltransferase
MQALQSGMQPPDLTGVTGVRGRVSRFAKRIVRKLVAWYVEPRLILQRDFDAHTVAFADSIRSDVQQLRAELGQAQKRLESQRLQTMTAIERANLLRAKLEQMVASIEAGGSRASDPDGMFRLRRDMSRLLERIGVPSPSGADIDYVAFEERFRGSSETLKAAQERYLSLFPAAHAPGLVVDVGCGRGDMLELLRDAGHDVLGLDLDSGMVEACVAKGLPAVEGDAIFYLDRLEDNSLKGIFCAQVVEHLLTSELEALVRLAYLKLQPEAPLVVETINPRSWYALGNHFFADTTHIRPVHPETLRFICEQIGFRRVQLEERSPHPMLAVAEDLPKDGTGDAIRALIQSVFGHQDYVIAANK